MDLVCTIHYVSSCVFSLHSYCQKLQLVSTKNITFYYHHVCNFAEYPNHRIVSDIPITIYCWVSEYKRKSKRFMYKIFIKRVDRIYIKRKPSRWKYVVSISKYAIRHLVWVLIYVFKPQMRFGCTIKDLYHDVHSKKHFACISLSRVL